MCCSQGGELRDGISRLVIQCVVTVRTISFSVCLALMCCQVITESPPTTVLELPNRDLLYPAKFHREKHGRGHFFNTHLFPHSFTLPTCATYAFISLPSLPQLLTHSLTAATQRSAPCRPSNNALKKQAIATYTRV